MINSSFYFLFFNPGQSWSTLCKSVLKKFQFIPNAQFVLQSLLPFPKLKIFVLQTFTLELKISKQRRAEFQIILWKWKFLCIFLFQEYRSCIYSCTTDECNSATNLTSSKISIISTLIMIFVRSMYKWNIFWNQNNNKEYQKQKCLFSNKVQIYIYRRNNNI